jgi:transcription elongation factor GreB
MRERGSPRKGAVRQDAASPASLLPPSDRETIGFGATVTVRDESATARVYAIVADADANIPAGKVGLGSPLAQALLGARVGEVVVWKRPAGEALLEIESIAYDD